MGVSVSYCKQCLFRFTNVVLSLNEYEAFLYLACSTFSFSINFLICLLVMLCPNMCIYRYCGRYYIYAHRELLQAQYCNKVWQMLGHAAFKQLHQLAMN